jgi:hypothetical protein
MALAGGCDVFLPNMGGPGQPCLENGTCRPGLTCLSGICRPGCQDASDCGDDIACTRDDCQAGVCTHQADDSRCPDDGQYCNGEEFCDELRGCWRRGEPCSSGVCDETHDVCVVCGDGVVTSALEDCDPGPPQNDECCDPIRCRWEADGAECGERFCSFLEWRRQTCISHRCTGEALVEKCFDPNECTIDDCHAALGCTHDIRNNGEECGDRSCQGLDLYKQICLDGNCVGTVLQANCDDGDSCTEDACDSAVGCRNTLTPNDLPDVCGSEVDENCDGIIDGCCGPDGTFAEAVFFPVGTGLRGIVVADFDRDGILDLAVANAGSNSVSVLLGNGSSGRGDGTFAPKTDYPAGTGPSDVVSGDFDRDGILDLAVANAGSNNVSVLLGNGSSGRGDGTFSPKADYPVGTGPAAIATDDFNEDGLLDLATASGSNSVEVLLGHGSGGASNGRLGSAVPFSARSQAVGVTAGDFNADGILDLAVLNVGTDDVSILLGNGQEGRGDGTFLGGVEYAVGDFPYYSAAGDFNADGILDLAVANSDSNNVSVLLGNGGDGRGDGTFGLKTDYPTGIAPRTVITGDFNSDGILDLATANLDGNSVSLLLGRGAEGRGDGTFAPRVDYPVGNQARMLCTGDFNADGILDLAVVSVASDRVNILLGQGQDGRGDGTFVLSNAFETGDEPRYITAGDFNADGVLDLIVVNSASNSLSVLLGNGSEGRGDGTFAQKVDIPTGEHPLVVGAADLDGNNILDLLVTSIREDSVSLYLGGGNDGRGDGTFAARVSYKTGVDPYGLALGDFNSDGLLDVATSNWTSLDVTILLGSGTCLPSP